MNIFQKPFKSVITTHTCEFHQKHPLEKYAGCTCSSSYSIIELNKFEELKNKIMKEHDELWKKLNKI